MTNAEVVPEVNIEDKGRGKGLPLSAGQRNIAQKCAPLRGTEEEVLSPVEAAAGLAFCRFLLC